MFFYFKWYIKRRTSDVELLAEYRTEVNRLIADLDSVTDRDSLLVEERIKKLNALLDDTDKRIAVYVRELDRSRTGEALYSSLGRGIRAALNTPQTPPSASASSGPAAAVENIPPAESSIAPSAQHAEAIPERPSKQQIRVQIAGLAAQGLSPSEIASRLDLSLSEVDLALNLLGRSAK